MLAGMLLKDGEMPDSRAHRIALTMAVRSRSLQGSTEGSVTTSRKSWPLVCSSDFHASAVHKALHSVCEPVTVSGWTRAVSCKQGTQEIDPSEIHICEQEDGRPWLLGSGSFGQARSCPHPCVYRRV
jgi:hypothetical protein